MMDLLQSVLSIIYGGGISGKNNVYFKISDTLNSIKAWIILG